uniref:Uncharacterized protein n=1 Tax=Panagrolaimus superbus TaxID=310955 RepID=A0A914YRQ1_9BILA
MDSEIIQIIEDILDHDISVAAALNRIYYITGDRPSLRIFQQRVRRFREQRNKDAQKNGRKSILKRKYISSKEIKAFYDRFENLSMPSTSTLKEGGNQFERIECKKFENLNELSSNNATAAVSSAPTSYFDDIFYHSNHDSIQNVQLQEFNSFKRNQNFDQNFENNSNQIATTAGNVLMTEASAEEKDSTTKLETSEIDCILQNLCYSGPVYPDNNNNNASNINSKIDAQKTFQSLPPSTNDKFNNAPILTPLDPLEHHQNNATDWSNAASNINKTSYFNINQQQQNSSITTLPPPPPPPPTTQYSTFLNSTISSSTTTFKANSIQPQISSSPIFLSSNELLFDDIGGIITAQKINALIDEIDPEWIQKLLDESDESMDAIFGDENDATKIIKPKKMKNLCINIENILNFMNLSISVYLHHSKINIFDQKIWKSFGTSLNDLIKLKDIYEAFEDENSSAIVNRTIFVHDVMNWICGAFDGGIGNEEVRAFLFVDN